MAAKKTYFVRPGLVYPASTSKTYEPGETVSLTEEEYKLVAHIVQTKEQQDAMDKASKTTITREVK